MKRSWGKKRWVVLKINHILDISQQLVILKWKHIHIRNIALSVEMKGDLYKEWGEKLMEVKEKEKKCDFITTLLKIVRINKIMTKKTSGLYSRKIEIFFVY